MTMRETIGTILNAWTGSVAAAIVAGLERVVSPRVVRLIEDEQGGFAVEAQARSDNTPARMAFADGAFSPPNLTALFRGSRVEIVLLPKRFLFRPLELPARASAFVEGIVRAQIDRLTPWSANEAVFGCTTPAANGAEGITTVVAATTRKVAMAYVQAASTFHPAAVAICAEATERNAGRVKVFEQKARGSLDPARLGRRLLAGLGILAGLALAATAFAAYETDRLGTQESEFAQQLSQARAAIRAASGGAEHSPAAALERRKIETPASVVMLDVLTQVLPDHTYVTELHLAGSKLQISGVTRDAPSLIPLMEQSPHFTHATFFAPTTRTPSDPGERFHIETLVQGDNRLAP